MKRRKRKDFKKVDVDVLREELIASLSSSPNSSDREEAKYVRDYNDEDVYRLADDEGIDIFEPRRWKFQSRKRLL